jgi:hypothetical protein
MGEGSSDCLNLATCRQVATAAAAHVRRGRRSQRSLWTPSIHEAWKLPAGRGPQRVNDAANLVADLAVSAMHRGGVCSVPRMTA